MGHFARFGVVGCLLTAAAASSAAPSPATGTFPPAPPPGAPVSASSTALPPPPPPPPPGAPAPGNAPAAAPEMAPPPAAAAPATAAPAAAPAPPYAAYPPPAYGYYYPPLYYVPPPPRARERIADDAALSSSPFIDVIVASVSWQNRVSQFLNVGVQGGVYVAGRVRLTANILLPSGGLTDDYEPAYEGDYVRQQSNAASLFYGASLGIVALTSPTFVMSPGLAFSRTDVADYGSSLAVSLPFEWVTASGLRIGMEFDAGRAFGGSNHLQCLDTLGNGSGCSLSPPVTEDRPAGTSVVLQFQLGFGFNHPEPLPPSPVQNAAPRSLPAAPSAPAAPSPSPAPASTPS